MLKVIKKMKIREKKRISNISWKISLELKWNHSQFLNLTDTLLVGNSLSLLKMGDTTFSQIKQK
jgi:hypothetical protein